jgi:predicted nucleotidyltransferase
MIIQDFSVTRCNMLSQKLAAHPGVEAAALYGSVARGDFEDHSDLDLLVFSRRSPKLSVRSDLLIELRDLGSRLSLVVYSESEMRFLSSVQSLFLLHLSREARLLFDKTGFLTDLLSTFTPKESYREDFAKSAALVDPLRTLVLGTPNQRHRLSYVYSLFRVFGVYLLAENGVYEFSKDKMAKQLAWALPPLKRQIESLSELRVLNSNFFSGGSSYQKMSDRFECSELADRVSAIGALLGQTISVRRLTYREAVEEFASATAGSCKSLDYRLRMWFLLLVYDGLNLYLGKIGQLELTDLREGSLQRVAESQKAIVIRAAARETVEYLHRYPLKYFLSEQARISVRKARQIVADLSATIETLPGRPRTAEE